MQITLKKNKPFWTLQDGITQSLIAEWLACKERATLNYKAGWTPVTTSNALTFGTLFHSCLEALYKHIQAKKELTAIKGTIDFVIRDYKQQTAAERLWGPEDEQTLQLNRGYLEVLVPAYFKKWEKKDRSKTYLAIEEEFSNPWSGNIPLRGKMDIVYSVGGEVWIMDHKTKSRMDDGSEDKLSFDLQGLFYILNWKLKTGTLATGFIQNIVQRSGLRQGKDETLQHFIERVKGDVDDSYFKRVQMTINKEEFDTWLKNEFTPIMDEICGWANGLLPNYKNTSSCQTRYGNCAMLRICGMKDFTGLFKRKTPFMELV